MRQKPDLPEFFTVNELSEQLRMTPLTVRRLLTGGVIPGVKFGHVWRIPRQELLDWMDSHHNQKNKPK